MKRIQRSLTGVGVLGILLGGQASVQAWYWSWTYVDSQAAPYGLFAYRGSATFELGAQYAAPGVPPNQAPLYGIIRYRDNYDSVRDYDLYFTNAGAIWKLIRYDVPPYTSQYVGGYNYSECNDGNVTATDRVLQPAIGLNLNYGTDGGAYNTLARTNYGCMNGHFGQPWPIDNYQMAGSGRGILPDVVYGPYWDHYSQSLFAISRPKPWIFYTGVLDPSSQPYLLDFPINYGNPSLIQNQIVAAQNNVQIETQIRINPDGSIMLTHLFVTLTDRPWMQTMTDGYWLAFDSAPNGRVFYTTPQGAYIEPFAGGQNPGGLNLYPEDTGGWVGYFIDQVRPDFGVGFYCGTEGGTPAIRDRVGTIGILPAGSYPTYGSYPYGPAVAHTDRYGSLAPNGGMCFRQTFIVMGYKEEMQAMASSLNPFVKVINSLP